ncbi:uncharacterized protein [Diadema antillarum]|uniref:uncharacterized protein n=1 Tax=Diadema antillarum TaxID=105358 RepID=UPI003A8C0F88
MNSLKDKGNNLVHNRKFRDAYGMYTQALKIGVFNHILYSNRCHTSLQMENFVDAMWDARRAVILKPDWPKGHYRYAQAFFELGELDRALRENKRGQTLCAAAKTSTVDLKRQAMDFDMERHRLIEEKETEGVPDLVSDDSESDSDGDRAHRSKKTSQRPGDLNRDLEKEKREWEKKIRKKHDDKMRKQFEEKMRKEREMEERWKREEERAMEQEEIERRQIEFFQRMTMEREAREMEEEKRRLAIEKQRLEEQRRKLEKQKEGKEGKKKEKKKRKKEQAAARKQQEASSVRRDDNLHARLQEEAERKKLEEEARRKLELEKLQRDMEQRELQTNLKEGSAALLSGKNRQAISLYEKAMNLLTASGKKYGGMHEPDYILFLYAHAQVLLGSNIPSEVLEGLEKLEKIVADFPAVRIGLVFYGLAEANYKLNRFSEALDAVEKGTFIIDHFNQSIQTWPGTNTNIKETEKGRLNAALAELRNSCKYPPRPDAHCRYPECTIKREIYLSDLDFKGYIKVRCSERCQLEYHTACWKTIKANMNISIEKDALNTPCPTPDCVGTLDSIKVYGANGLQKTETKVEKPVKQKEDIKPKQQQPPGKSRKDQRKDKKFKKPNQGEQRDMASSGSGLLLGPKKSKSKPKKYRPVNDINELMAFQFEEENRRLYGAENAEELENINRKWQSTLAVSLPEDRPFAIPEHLKEAAANLEASFGVSKEEDEEEEESRRMALYLNLKDLFESHGPLHLKDPILISWFIKLPFEHKKLILKEGGLETFLCRAQDIVLVGRYAGLLRDERICRELAEADPDPSRHNLSGMSESTTLRNSSLNPNVQPFVPREGGYRPMQQLDSFDDMYDAESSDESDDESDREDDSDGDGEESEEENDEDLEEADTEQEVCDLQDPPTNSTFVEEEGAESSPLTLSVGEMETEFGKTDAIDDDDFHWEDHWNSKEHSREDFMESDDDDEEEEEEEYKEKGDEENKEKTEEEEKENKWEDEMEEEKENEEKEEVEEVVETEEKEENEADDVEEKSVLETMVMEGKNEIPEESATIAATEMMKGEDTAILEEQNQDQSEDGSSPDSSLEREQPQSEHGDGIDATDDSQSDASQNVQPTHLSASSSSEMPSPVEDPPLPGSHVSQPGLPSKEDNVGTTVTQQDFPTASSHEQDFPSAESSETRDIPIPCDATKTSCSEPEICSSMDNEINPISVDSYPCKTTSVKSCSSGYSHVDSVQTSERKLEESCDEPRTDPSQPSVDGPTRGTEGLGNSASTEDTAVASKEDGVSPITHSSDTKPPEEVSSTDRLCDQTEADEFLPISSPGISDEKEDAGGDTPVNDALSLAFGDRAGDQEGDQTVATTDLIEISDFSSDEEEDTSSDSSLRKRQPSRCLIRMLEEADAEAEKTMADAIAATETTKADAAAATETTKAVAVAATPEKDTQGAVAKLNPRSEDYWKQMYEERFNAWMEKRPPSPATNTRTFGTNTTLDVVEMEQEMEQLQDEIDQLKHSVLEKERMEDQNRKDLMKRLEEETRKCYQYEEQIRELEFIQTEYRALKDTHIQLTETWGMRKRCSEEEERAYQERAMKAEIQYVQIMQERDLKHLVDACTEAEQEVETINDIIENNPSMEVHVRPMRSMWDDAYATNLNRLEEARTKFQKQVRMIGEGATLDSLTPVEIPFVYKPEGLQEQKTPSGAPLPSQMLPQVHLMSQAATGSWLDAPFRAERNYDNQGRMLMDGASANPAGVAAVDFIRAPSQPLTVSDAKRKAQALAQALGSVKSDTAYPPLVAGSNGGNQPQHSFAVKAQAQGYANLQAKQRALESQTQPWGATGTTPSITPQQQQQPAVKPKNSFERIMLRLSTKFPTYNKVQLTNFLKEVRTANKGSLSGLSVDDIMVRVSDLVRKRHRDPANTASQRTLNTGQLSYSTGLLARPTVPQTNSELQSRRPTQYQPAPSPAQPAWGQVSKTEPGINWKKELRDGEDMEEDPCVICHDEMDGDNLLELTCGHTFHKKCIMPWLKRQKTCPTCRTYIVLENEFPTLGH